MGFENESNENADYIEFGDVVDQNGDPVCSEEQPVITSMIAITMNLMA